MMLLTRVECCLRADTDAGGVRRVLWRQTPSRSELESCIWNRHDQSGSPL